MKQFICILTALLLSVLAAGACAQQEETVLFQGEKKVGRIVGNNWKNIVQVNLTKVDKSIFSQPFDIVAEYEGEEAPQLMLCSWTGGTSQAEINADFSDGSQARYSYQSILRAYGELFSKLGSITLRTKVSNTKVTKLSVVPALSSEVSAVVMPGKAGEWLASARIGWNLGNTLDVIGEWIGNNKPYNNYETAWGNPLTTREMIQAVADAGFDVIRIPVSWGQHMDANNVVEEQWMARVQTIVDWSLEAGLKVILNVHHDTGTDGWLRADMSLMDQQLPRFTALWQQIAQRFADYDDRLVFEGYNELLDSQNHWNEPGKDALQAANQLNQAFVDTVRASSGYNPERVLIVTTYAGAQDETSLSGFVLPTDPMENALIVQVHVYSPVDFCFSESEGYAADDWTKVNGRSEVNGIVNRLYNHFTSRNIPVIIGEFSASAKHNETNRAEWATYLTARARQEGILCVWWDNGGTVIGGADGYTGMGLLDRRKVEWLYPEIVKALTGVDVTNPVLGKTWQDYDPLYEAAANHGFKLGACYSYSQLRDKNYLSLMSAHFNSITPTNELKAYSLLDQRATRSRTDGMPGLNWAQADQMLSWAQQNGIQVRGHVLVWDAYMTDWFFREDYDQRKPYADQATIRERMAYYIHEVMTHCETSFPGVVYCWDVVNEAVGDSPSEYAADDPRHLRTLRSGQTNLFRDLAGDDYVAYAFLCARNTAEELGADIKLFYNDYNTYQPTKMAAITALVESVNTYAVNDDGSPRILCDGVGMQGYIGGYGTQDGCMNSADVQAIRAAILHYGSLGLQVHVTEMSIRNYSDSEQDDLRHAEFTKELFSMFAGINDGQETPILTCVALWGVTDCNSLPSSHYTWKLNGPYCGLVTEKLALKRAFHSVYEALSPSDN